ncbi:YdeI/OmpD-associated family protein [Paracoccus aerodenitrificans]|uniref:YdeI/OmpD-associated family protein n=1 Tax=Paracoccus aerodenitrificans TaxID=3017781 RepID=UPI0022F09AD2|nr:YdeI/OmpD-associated family protein [Paracoccus aerodenitrificans]WBU64210.1 YdeI/OmpD-associated family protein [Paracoccus aerodenitrificans]
MVSAQVRADAFFSRLDSWKEELLALRDILRSCDLTEDFKWSSPVYTHDGGNIAIIWGFKDRAALGFFKGVLLTDPERVLEAPGENSRSSRMLNFTSLSQIDKMRPVITAYLAEAIAIEQSGAKVEMPKDDLAYPEELQARLDENPDFRLAFEGLTPGRRRGWVLHFSGAKQSATRVSRIDKATQKILEGKGMQDR